VKNRGSLSGRFRTRAGFAVVILSVLFLCKSFVINHRIVISSSMFPTLFEGDLVIVNQLAYGLRCPLLSKVLWRRSAPEKGDIVVFAAPDLKSDLVKRVVGTPGDTIRVADDQLFINGTPVRYAAADPESLRDVSGYMRILGRFSCEMLNGKGHLMMRVPAIPSRKNFGPVTIPPGHYFVMGDNRTFSADSRFFGFVEQDQIIGKVEKIFASLDIIRDYRPRWHRFFRGVA